MLKLAKRFACFFNLRGRGHMAAGKSGVEQRPQGACGMAEKAARACGKRDMFLTGAGAALQVGPTVNPHSRY